MTRRPARLVAVLALVALGSGALAGPAAGARPADRLITRLGDGVRVSRNSVTGLVGFLGGTEARPLASAASLGGAGSPRAASAAFLDRYAALFGVTNPARDLRVSGSSRAMGRTFVRYQQLHRGLPVVAGELIVQVGPGNDVISVNGEASPGLAVDTRPAISAKRARTLAIAATARQEKVKATTLRAGPARLVIYDAALTGDPRALPGGRLAWRVDVRSARRPIDEWVAIEATRGGVLAAFNQVATAVPPDAVQRVCDMAGARATGGEGTSDGLQCDPTGEPTLVVDPGGSAVSDVRDVFIGAEATYDFYANHFGRNSLDGAGMMLVSTARYCPEAVSQWCPWPNAMWNGTQMFYGEGWTADDIVGHELTHGVTEFTSGLLYWFQSGAINEAFSDIFGEFIDQEDGLGTDTPDVRWLLGEDMPTGPNRNLKEPSLSAQGSSPDRMRSPLYNADPSLTDRGGVHYNSAVGAKAAYLMTDGARFNGQRVRGIGLDKVAAIWYRAGTRLLTSGSDYSDLAAALTQACKDLTGTTPKDMHGAPSSSGRVSAADCAQVGKAITATEMRLDALVATVKHTALCATGSPTKKPLKDAITDTASGWLTSGTSDVWYVGDWFSTSGKYALWATDTRYQSRGAIRSRSIKIPASGKTYLAFRNYVNMQQWNLSLGGGIVEYATNPAGPWKDLRKKFLFNGYNGTIATGYGNPLEGRKAFVGMSYGLGVSKADLTFLKGKTIYLRFTIATNADATGFDGWVIDDVRVYQCK